MKLSHILLVVAAVAAVAAAVWYFTRPSAVTVVLPSRGDAAEIVYANGVVEPRYWARVTSLVRERIVDHCDCEGEAVQQGQVLARLNEREAQTVLAELEARLILAEDEYKRLAVLAERHVVSQQVLDRARSEVAQLQALVAGQTVRMENYVLRAPSAGIVLRRDGEVGEIAEPGTTLFWVGQPRPLVVIAEVNEEDIPRVAIGQPTLLRSEAFPGRNLEAVVDNITPKGDPVTRTYRVRFLLPDDTPLMIGMSVDVNVITRVSDDALLVPSLAVRGNTLFVAEDGVAHHREVGVGIRGIRDVEILSGIAESTRVISPYPENLSDGARISVAAE